MALKEFALTSALVVSVASVASAQSGQRYEFSEVDADGDGAVTMEELQAVFETGADSEENNAEAVLELQDTDGDGAISAEEAGADMAIYSMGEGEEDVEEQGEGQ